MFKKNGSLEFVYICFEHVALRDYDRDNSWHFLRRIDAFKTFLDICEKKKKKKKGPFIVLIQLLSNDPCPNLFETKNIDQISLKS